MGSSVLTPFLHADTNVSSTRELSSNAAADDGRVSDDALLIGCSPAWLGDDSRSVVTVVVSK